MREILLTQGQVALVDDEDFERVNQYKWYARYEEEVRTFYAVRSTYNIKDKSRGSQYMHRSILNVSDSELIDHADHSGLNNTRANLRLCTNRQNQRNKRKNRGVYTSKYKGVHFYKERQKWVAKITYDGKSRHVGIYKTELEAALAYDEKAREVDSQHYLCNFPIPVSAA